MIISNTQFFAALGAPLFGPGSSRGWFVEESGLVVPVFCEDLTHYHLQDYKTISKSFDLKGCMAFYFNPEYIDTAIQMPLNVFIDFGRDRKGYCGFLMVYKQLKFSNQYWPHEKI